VLIASVKTSQGKKVVLKIVLVVDVINVVGLLSFFFSYYFRKSTDLELCPLTVGLIARWDLGYRWVLTPLFHTFVRFLFTTWSGNVAKGLEIMTIAVCREGLLLNINCSNRQQSLKTI